MSRCPGRLAFAAALLSAAPAMVGAVQTDVRGNWQVNINCDLNATASIFFLLDEDVGSGSTTVRYTDCGTFEVPDALQELPTRCGHQTHRQLHPHALGLRGQAHVVDARSRPVR